MLQKTLKYLWNSRKCLLKKLHFQNSNKACWYTNGCFEWRDHLGEWANNEFSGEGCIKLSSISGLEKVDDDDDGTRCEFYQRAPLSHMRLEREKRHVWMTLNTMSCCPHYCSASFFCRSLKRVSHLCVSATKTASSSYILHLLTLTWSR